MRFSSIIYGRQEAQRWDTTVTKYILNSTHLGAGLLEFRGGRHRHLLARTATGRTEIHSVRRGTRQDLSRRTHFSLPRTGLMDRLARTHSGETCERALLAD
jgi:hypothetical protein